MNSTTALTDLPPAVLAGVGVLIVVQLALQIAALVSLVRTPAERVTLGRRKWLWALIIVLGEIIGSIIWFVAGRTPAPAAEAMPAQPADERAKTAADALYGSPEQGQR